MATLLKASGRSADALRKMRSSLGDLLTEQVIDASTGYRHAIPVAGAPGILVYDGVPMPVMGGGGFSSLSDIISEATGGSGNAGTIKQQTINFGQVSALAAAANESLWGLSGFPGPGATPTALAAGAVPTRATVGSLEQANAGAGDTLHILSTAAMASATPATLVLYDRLWHGRPAMNSTAAQTVSGTPNRYTGAAAAGNVVWIETATALPATAHNHTITYVDDSGNAAEAAALVNGIASAAIGRLDMAVSAREPWFVPLNAGDQGVRNITQYQCSAAVATGQFDLVIARPLAFIPLGGNNVAAVHDGLNSAFNLAQVLDNAALAFMVLKGTATASVYSGQLVLVSG